MADRVRHDATMTVVMLAFYVIAQVHDLFASDIETCLHVSASLASSSLRGPCRGRGNLVKFILCVCAG